MNRDQAAHWQHVFAEREPAQMSWTEVKPDTSLELVQAATPSHDGAIIDVGGGASRLAAELLHRGYRDLTVADIAPAALDRARAEIGPDADRIAWVQADVRDHDFGRRFDLWHDRAVFHFMVEAEDLAAYLATLERSLHPGGSVVIATFGPQGPTECSGLPVARYGAEEIAATFGQGFRLLASRLVVHHTPGGNDQQFAYALLRREPGIYPWGV